MLNNPIPKAPFSFPLGLYKVVKYKKGPAVIIIISDLYLTNNSLPPKEAFYVDHSILLC